MNHSGYKRHRQNCHVKDYLFLMFVLLNTGQMESLRLSLPSPNPDLTAASASPRDGVLN